MRARSCDAQRRGKEQRDKTLFAALLPCHAAAAPRVDVSPTMSAYKPCDTRHYYAQRGARRVITLRHGSEAADAARQACRYAVFVAPRGYFAISPLFFAAEALSAVSFCML
jgi:hypothetical protein